MHILLLVALVLLAYVYAGYPLLLRGIVQLRGARPIRRRDITPPVSLVISAYNEAAVIRQKLENTIALDYPGEQLEVVVVSDASDDGTDAIVEGYRERGVRLIRQAHRRGKTAGLNLALPTLQGDVIVFSDANAVYAPDALRKLVRNFADPAVGCVTGEARYLGDGRAAADLGERIYWTYEMHIKRLESAVGSMVGGDGAIYAIRKECWRTLPEAAINDFLNPLQIVESGWRAVYEPEAVCHERTVGTAGGEYRRRVRIVSRSWRAILQASGVLNPLRVGFFAVSVASHKILRWLSGVFVASAGVAAVALVVSIPAFWVPLAVLAVAVGGMCAVSRACRRAGGMLGYFIVINTASLIGLLKGSVGAVSGTWQPERPVGSPLPVPSVRGGLVILLGVSVTVLAGAALLIFAPSATVVERIFWGAVALLGYVYVGYPILMALLRRTGRPIRRSAVEPQVCLLIAASNEAAVIEAKVRNSLALDYPRDRLQILVASDGSTDRTNEIVGRFAADGVQLLAFPRRRGKMAAINEAVRATRTEIVVFSDANTFLDRTAVRALVRGFADESVGAISGDVVLIGERAALARPEDLYYRFERWLQAAESDAGSMIGVDGALYAIRRRLFEAPPDSTILDDMAVPMAVVRAGYRVVFESAALAYEHGSESAVEEFARKARVVAGAVQFLARRDSSVPLVRPQVALALVSHKALRWFSPAFALLAYLAALMLAGDSPVFLAAAAVQTAGLALAVAGCVPRLRRWTPVGMLHYLWLVQTAAAVGLLRGLVGRQSVIWRRFDRVPVEAG